MHKAAWLMFIFAACSASPRTTTLEERTTTLVLLTQVETALAALVIAGTISQEDFALAHAQLSELRQQVEQSAAVPVSWLDLEQRVINFAAVWLAARDE